MFSFISYAFSRVIKGALIWFFIGAGVIIVGAIVFGGLLHIGESFWLSLVPNIWRNCLFFSVFGGLLGLVNSIRDEMASNRFHREERERLQQAAVDEAARQRAAVAALPVGIERDYLQLPKHVAAAQKHLERAAFEFGEKAFAPFWDEVERAVQALDAFNRGVQGIAARAAEYDRQALQHGGLPRFSPPAHVLPDPAPLAENLAKLVREAQKDFQFASIFEQRRTNQLLLRGFTSLNESIRQLGSGLAMSIGHLSQTVNSSMANLLLEQREQTRSLHRQEGKVEDIRRRWKPYW